MAHQIIIFFTITIFLFLFHIAACINANTHVNNLIGTSSTMVDQWLIDVTQGTAFPPVSSPPSGFYELNQCVMSNSWFGFTVNDANLASIRTTLNGCGRARLDYGNCYFCFFCDSSNYNFVFVRLNGIEISRAANNNRELSITVEFDFKDGNILELFEVGLSAIKFNGFSVISCIPCA